ncbi:MAG: hypothetical protein F4104_02505, partial [Gemmatimonadetes bacterium]|nr:hypothetical protein [Gemmatimonadota bacterium]
MPVFQGHEPALLDDGVVDGLQTLPAVRSEGDPLADPEVVVVDREYGFLQPVAVWCSCQAPQVLGHLLGVQKSLETHET